MLFTVSCLPICASLASVNWVIFNSTFVCVSITFASFYSAQIRDKFIEINELTKLGKLNYWRSNFGWSFFHWAWLFPRWKVMTFFGYLTSASSLCAFLLCSDILSCKSWLFVWIAAPQTAVLKWMNTRSFTYNCSSYIDSFTQNKRYLYEEVTTGENSSKTESWSKTFRKCLDSRNLRRGIHAL